MYCFHVIFPIDTQEVNRELIAASLHDLVTLRFLVSFQQITFG